jgi:phospholipid transport system substrate-binding protein
MTRYMIGRRAVLEAALLGAVAAALPARAAETAVLVPIQQLVAALLDIMKAGAATPFATRAATLGPVIDRVFDLPTILRESVGPTWASLPGDQQTSLEAAFRSYTLASYVNSFDSYDGQRFEVSPDTRSLPNGEQVVRTRIIPVRGDSHQLDYVMRRIDGGWRVVDVLADGAVSRVAVQRSDFRRLLTRGGAPALLSQLQQKVADLSGGAMG